MKQSQQQKVIVNIGKPVAKRRRRKPVAKKPSPPILPDNMRVINASGTFQPTANLAENIAQILRPPISGIMQNTRPRTILEEKRVADFVDQGKSENDRLAKAREAIRKDKEALEKGEDPFQPTQRVSNQNTNLLSRFSQGIFAPTQELPMTMGGGRKLADEPLIPRRRITEDDIQELLQEDSDDESSEN